jgi:hypothetical protein
LKSSNEPTKADQIALIAELQQAGIKHTPENIIAIAKTPDGKIVFLETGNSTSGMQHILRNHTLEFADQKILPAEIPDAIMTAITHGEIIGYQGVKHPTPRAIYQFTFKGETKRMAVQVSKNGYIVSANPSSYP